MTHHRTFTWSLAAISALALSACHQQADTDPNPQEEAGLAPDPQTEQDAQATDAGQTSTEAPLDDPALIPAVSKGEAGARVVLTDWARSIESGDYVRAYAQWGESGDASGMSESEYVDYWRKLGQVKVAVKQGESDAGAGSLYYAAPTTITAQLRDGTRKEMAGTVVLRRANDVPGATAAQLRWHLSSADFKEKAAGLRAAD